MWRYNGVLEEQSSSNKLANMGDSESLTLLGRRVKTSILMVYTHVYVVVKKNPGSSVFSLFSKTKASSLIAKIL